MNISFIDLFSGIGAFNQAFSAAGGRCVFANDYDEKAASQYLLNYKGSGDYFYPGPISKWTTDNKFMVPKHNILVAGFPCQPFSIAGVSKKNALGQKHGFLDKTQGTLFFDIAKILKKRKPDVFLLENVKNLKYHNKGDTYRTIIDCVTKLGYIVNTDIIDAVNFVPQHRERIFIVGFKKKYKHVFEFPKIKPKRIDLVSLLDKEVEDKYTLTPKLWSYLKKYKAKHKAAGNGFGYGLIEPGFDTHTRTISARYYKDGAEALISRGEGELPRRLTPSECAKLMGFPKRYKFKGISDTEAYKQFGNAVVVPVATVLAEAIVDQLSPFLSS